MSASPEMQADPVPPATFLALRLSTRLVLLLAELGGQSRQNKVAILSLGGGWLELMLVGDVKVKGDLGYSDHEVAELRILRAKRVKSKVATLDYRRAL